MYIPSEKTTYRLTPFFQIRFHQPLVCDLLLEGTSVELPDPRFLTLIGLLSEKELLPAEHIIACIADVLDLSNADANVVLADLLECKLLVSVSDTYPQLPGVKHWLKRNWLDALILHLRSRDLAFADNLTPDPEAFNASVIKNFIESQGMPEIWKEYPGYTPRDLTSPADLPAAKLEQVLLSRRSNRPWRGGRLSQEVLSRILKDANVETFRLRQEAEKTWRENPAVLLNSSFSALETYIFAFEIEGLEPGLYHYDVRKHRVILLKQGLLRSELVKMCIGQSRPEHAACAFVITAVWSRYMFRYRHPRAYRTILINTGELAQKYILLATAFGLSTFLTPALEDEYADQILGVRGFEEGPLYVVAVG